LRILVLKAEFYLKFQANHWMDRIKAPTIRNLRARLNNSIVDGLQSEALNSLDATYVFVRQN
jgi:hypothetical protein